MHKYLYVGCSQDDALDLIESLPDPEAQAEALIENSGLTHCKRGAALMKRIASNSTPARARLFAVQKERDAKKAAERATKKAHAAQRSLRPKAPKIVPPSLFESFK